MTAIQSRLSLRERQVLEYIADGRTNGQIAARLCICEGTVKKHLVSLRDKLGAKDRAHAVTLAMQTGELELR